ncbi:PHP domain-containing protein [Candidatus Woesearchaeota archaeon]|jgi:predicted metal-dependent phosphoesterase TrpH|nr:PHP domain-containing protein [Candidatus Woesearchaeota archaeon]MBT7367877.1 PHP domain-containing protein [Candidatus Woesearchaeota archaeon]
MKAKKIKIKRKRKQTNKQKKYELHTHTKYSDCSNIEPINILKKAKQKGLNGIAITDHNTIKGALQLKKLNEKSTENGFEIIIGEEISTDKGEIICLGLKKEIKPGKLFDVIHEIKKQKGIIGIPHPYGKGIVRKSLMLKLNKTEKEKLMKDIDYIETNNGRSTKTENKKAKKLCLLYRLTEVGGSDAHFINEIGNIITIIPANETLNTAIKKKKTYVLETNKSSWVLKIKSGILKLKKKMIKRN